MKIYKIILFLIAINFISCALVIESIEKNGCMNSEFQFSISVAANKDEITSGLQLTVKLSSPSNANPSCTYVIFQGEDFGDSAVIEINCKITSGFKNVPITISEVKFDSIQGDLSRISQTNNLYSCGSVSDSEIDS